MEESGFLSETLDDFKVHLRTNYRKHYDAAIEVNTYAQKLQYKIEITKYNTEAGVHIDTDHLLSSILYSRTISSYQAFLLLLQRGMQQQARVMLRCIFETLFALVAIQKNKNYSKRLIEADECDRLKAFNKIIRYRTRQSPDDDSINEIKELAATSKRIVEDKKLHKIGVEENADKAGLLDWYDTAYSLLSGTVHASIRSLQEALVLDEKEQDIVSLKNEPEMDDFVHLTSTAIEAVLYAVIAIGEIFKIDVEEFSNKTHSELKDLLENDG